MSVGPPLAGSSATFAYAVCKDLFVYIKHNQKRVKDLVKDFKDLRGELLFLEARWNDIEEKIESQSWSIQKNNQYTALENKVVRLRSKFERIEQKYREYCKNFESQNQRSQLTEASNGANVPNAPAREFAAPSSDGQQEASNGANVDQASTSARAQEFAAPSSDGQQEASNGANANQASTSAPALEFAVPSNVEQQKIWTRKFFKLAQLDKDIVELIPKIIAVKNEIRIEDLISQVKPKVVVRMEADELKNIIASHEKHLADLKEYLCGKNCKRIGIYGAPGVGITNIMKNLNNSFDPSTSSECNLELDYVIWVAVPDEPTKEEMIKNIRTKEEMIENVQGKIIQRLNIDWQKYKSLNPAHIISTELSKKKYVLLLDDFSSLIKLEEIGIHEEHKDGKVVIAAKNLTALRNVKLDECFEVKYLSLEDKGKLFNKFVEIDTLNEELRKMVGPILTQLGGLPGVIRSTAEYLNKDRDKQIWDAIKHRLQSDISISELLGLGGLEKAYRLFYEELEEISFKKCLLYAALFPNEHKIRKSTLVECWKAEQFFSYTVPTMDAARNEGAIVFSHLERRFLLQSCCEEYVKMPGYFRKIALVLRFPGDEDRKSIVRLGPEINGHEEEWKDARGVSLMRSKLKKLTSSPQCDRISTLLLQLNPYLETIEDPFFSSMKTLRVLDLHRTGISLLPSSISDLTALRCLYLNDCGKLTKLPNEIGKLEALEVLDIRGTLIPCLPEEISMLKRLSCLRISFVAEACNPNPVSKRSVLFKWLPAPPKSGTWVIFPPGIADNLHNLEELTIALGRTGISEEIRNRIQTEVSESTKVLFIHPFQSLDQENLIQSGEGTDLLNPSLPENPGHDLRTEIHLPRSNEASKNYKGKGIANPVVDGQNSSAGASTSGMVGGAD